MEAQDVHAEASGSTATATNEATTPTPNKTGIYHSDRAILGLALYALSSVFLATMLICAKRLKQHGFPVWQNLLARSLSIMTFALIACARQRVNPFGNRYNLVLIFDETLSPHLQGPVLYRAQLVLVHVFA